MTSVLALGSVIGGRYELVATVGFGGMSEVFRATDRVTGEEVAVKVLRNVDPSFAHRFAREASALMQLDDPSIVRLRAEGVDHGSPYLVLDLVDGPSLAQEHQRGPMGEDDVVRIGAGIARALAHAHEAGVVHRDVKPGNILLAGDEREPKLVDFGVAMLADTTTITSAGMVVGTASYLAPEQLRGTGAGAAVDVYSLGLVLIEALSGARAFTGTPAEAAGARLVAPPALPPAASPWLAGVLAAMTSLDPAARPTAAAVARAFESRSPLAFADPDRTAVTYEPTSELPVVPVAPRRSRRLPRIVAALIAAVALAAVVVAAIFAGGGSGSPPAPTTTIVSVAPTTPTTPTTSPPTTAPPTTKAREHKGHGNQNGD